MNKTKIKTYAYSIVFALVVGGVSALLTSMGMDEYDLVEKPNLTPPDIVFPIVCHKKGSCKLYIYIPEYKHFGNRYTT